MHGTTSTNSSKAINRIPMATTDTRKNESGVHDLKALATSAKRRRTKRRTTQMEVQNSLLASNAGLDAVVLPDPNKSVAVKMPVDSTLAKKVAETSAKGVAKGSSATSSAKTSSTAAVASEIPSSPEESSNSKVGLIVVLGLAGAAVAAFLLMRGDGDATKQAEAGTPVKTPVALAESEALAAEKAGATTDENTANEVVTPDEALIAENGGGDEIDPEDPPDTPDESITALDPEEPNEVKPEKPTRVLTDEEKVEAKRLRDERIAAKKAAREEAKAEKIANAGKTKETKDSKEKPGKEKTIKGGDSLDDVLSSVTGGLDKQVEKKDTGPVKKTLGRSDVKKAMSRVAGRAKACHAKEQFSGMVTVKYGVRPDGSLTSISATGSHAGSATGKCVASAVKRAKFPAFAGSPMTFTYPFMLSP